MSSTTIDCECGAPATCYVIGNRGSGRSYRTGHKHELEMPACDDCADAERAMYGDAATIVPLDYKEELEEEDAERMSSTNGTGNTEDPYRLHELDNEMIQARRLVDLMEEHGWDSQAEAARQTGIVQWRISRLIRLTRLPPHKQAEVESGELGSASAVRWLRRNTADTSTPVESEDERRNTKDEQPSTTLPETDAVVVSEVQLLAGDTLTIIIAPLDDTLYLMDYDEQVAQIPLSDLPALQASLERAGNFFDQLNQ